MKKSFCLFTLATLFLSACAGPITMAPQADRQAIAEETARERELVYQKFITDQMRLFSVAFPLQAANADFCGEHTAPLLGMTAWNIETVAANYRAAAATLYGLDARTAVQAVARNSPAARAGIKAGDIIVAVGGQTLPEGMAGIRAATQIFDRAQYNPTAVIVERNGRAIETTLQPITGCDYPVVLNYDSAEINAYADGQKIVVSKGIVRFVENDNELAMVVAHELGHSAMNHVSKLQQNATIGSLGGLAIDSLLGAAGVGTGGQFSQMGGAIAAQRYSIPFEQEADYVGMYFSARAGYNINGVADFWRRMGAEGEQSISLRTSHPTSPERYLAIEHTAAEINAKKSRGQALVPNFKSQ